MALVALGSIMATIMIAHIAKVRTKCRRLHSAGIAVI
jgi:hypothetical protein